MIKKFKWDVWRDSLKQLKRKIESGDEDFFLQQTNPVMMHTGLALKTPMGELGIPMTESSFVSDHINFWIMNTNFNLRKCVISPISNVSGVVSVEPLTRYSIRIGIPRSNLFITDNVHAQIEETIIHHEYQSQNQILTDNILDVDIRQKIMDIRNAVDKKYEYWSILVLPNGQTQIVTSMTKDDSYKNKQQELINIGNTTKSILLICQE
jgi:hypothetical protein